MLKQNFFELIKICIFKSKPENILYSLATLGAVLAINLFIFSYSMINVFGLVHGIIIAVTFIGVLTGYTFLVLKAFKLKERFIQTATGLLGCYGMLMILGFAVSLVMSFLVAAGVNADAFINLSKLLMMVIYVWSIAVCAYIFKYALETGWVLAIVNTVAMIALANLATVIVRQLIFKG